LLERVAGLPSRIGAVEPSPLDQIFDVARLWANLCWAVVDDLFDLINVVDVRSLGSYLEPKDGHKPLQ
jgi:hypothetical protein